MQPNANGSPGTAYPDGEDGIDNSFGKNLLPQILSLYPTWVSDINARILEGYFNVLFKLDCLPDAGDAPVFTTKLFGGTALANTPKFDGTDLWPVAPELLTDPTDPDSSAIVFNDCSVKGSTFDSGKTGTFILTVPLMTVSKSTSIKLTAYAARITWELSADRKSATKGVIGGVLDTEELITEVNKVGALLDLCQSSIFEGLLSQIRQASDIMADGTQDPTKTCNGISIGLAFELKEVQRGDVGPKTPPAITCQ